MAAVALDQDADEALHGAENGAVEHHRAALLAVGVDIERIEAFRQVEVDLVGAALPFAADRILQDVFELGPIERAFARIDAGFDLAAELCLRCVPEPST